MDPPLDGFSFSVLHKYTISETTFFSKAACTLRISINLRKQAFWLACMEILTS